MNIGKVRRRILGVIIDPVRTSLEIARDSTLQESILSFLLLSLGMGVLVGAASENPLLGIAIGAPVGVLVLFLMNFIFFGAIIWIVGRPFGSLLSLKRIYSIIGYHPAPQLIFFSSRPFLTFFGMPEQSLTLLQGLFMLWSLSLVIIVYNYASGKGWVRATLTICSTIILESFFILLFISASG